MIYYIYHIPGKKIGVTTNLKSRVEDQQGYGPGEYEVLMESKDIDHASYLERLLQVKYGYPVDIVPYDKLNCNKNKLNMKLNTTEQTTTFPCPANKLKGRLMDNIGMRWMTEHGEFSITPITIEWIMNNIKTSMFNDQRSYVYNKAFARFYDNNDAHYPQNGVAEEEEDCGCTDTVNPNPIEEWNIFDYIREWADERGLYDNGDAKTQALKLTEEVGETCRAILKQDHDEIVDGIGDCVVVLTNLAHLSGVSIEDCIEAAYEEIKDRTGKMENGTYKKD